MAKDLLHDVVTIALKKAGWSIVKESYKLTVDDEINYFIDIFAEKYIIAQREKRLILVEVKSFAGVSKTYDFHSAIGQYIVYHTALEYNNTEIKLYLAVPEAAYEGLLKTSFVQYLLEKYRINLMPFDPVEKVLL